MESVWVFLLLCPVLSPLLLILSLCFVTIAVFIISLLPVEPDYQFDLGWKLPRSFIPINVITIAARGN